MVVINTANFITLLRLVLVFFIVPLLYGSVLARVISIFLIILVIFLDYVDGFVARRFNQVSKFGGVFDIVVDRIVENVLWVVFASLGWISVWVPVIFITRGFLGDSVRALAFEKGKSAFGKDSMMSSNFGAWIVGSRFMRGLYGFSKVASFVLVVLASVFSSFLLDDVALKVVVFTTVLCVVRGIPVLLELKSVLKN